MCSINDKYYCFPSRSRREKRTGLMSISFQPYSQHIDLESCWMSKWPKLFCSSNYCRVGTDSWLQPRSGRGITHTSVWEMASRSFMDLLCQTRSLMTWILTDLCLGKTGGFHICGSQTEFRVLVMLVTSAPTTVGITGDSLGRLWASVLGAEMTLLFRTERVSSP